MKSLRPIKYPGIPAIGGSRAHGDERAMWRARFENMRDIERELLAVRSGCAVCLLLQIRDLENKK